MNDAEARDQGGDDSEAAEAEAPLSAPTPSGAQLKTEGERIAEVGPTMPADYLAIGKDNIAYPLRVQLIEQRGIPDRLVESAEDQPPGHYGPDSRLRPKIDSMLWRAAAVLIESEQKHNGNGNGNAGSHSQRE